ncbi:hypothetical protein ONS95_007206 [Cadophora gregata]|uniref:uncharacterized protein n=1 Tax=Cadophora gregata TaxID=51156 RepID=UPI0026DC0095|nr:uncharacterized protein ONS95_007206 [Cadophora gregata]KAK0100756.1 hypothetical protein ONS95_007206 [Cadophora gregata]
MADFTELQLTSTKPTRPPIANLSRLGSDMSSSSHIDNGLTRRRANSQQGGEAGHFVPVRKPKKKRVRLPNHRSASDSSAAIIEGSSLVASHPEPIPEILTQDTTVLKGASKFRMVPLESSLEHSTIIPTSLKVFEKTLDESVPSAALQNNYPLTVLDTSLLVNSISAIQNKPNNIHGIGDFTSWDTMLFTKRAAIANLAAFSRSINRAMNGNTLKSEIVNITRELAYAECTSFDIKQYMVASPGNSVAIRKIWPELVIFNATGSISYEIIGQSLVSWGPTGINGLEEFELIVLGWMKLAELHQLSRLNRLVEYKNEKPDDLSLFLQFRGTKLNATFWTPNGLKKLREDIWEAIDGGEFQRKSQAVSDSIGPVSTSKNSTRHLSLLRDGLGIYTFRLQPHHMSAADPKHDMTTSGAGNVGMLPVQKQPAMKWSFVVYT